MGQFTEGAQITQIMALLPKLEAKNDEMVPNLELMAKGIEAYIKIDVMHSDIIHKEGIDPRLNNMVH